MGPGAARAAVDGRAWADPIRRRYTQADLVPHLTAHGIDATVLVQSVSSYEDTAELLAVAAGRGRWPVSSAGPT